MGGKPGSSYKGALESFSISYQDLRPSPSPLESHVLTSSSLAPDTFGSAVETTPEQSTSPNFHFVARDTWFQTFEFDIRTPK
jgi:hypothetical protein